MANKVNQSDIIREAYINGSEKDIEMRLGLISKAP